MSNEFKGNLNEIARLSEWTRRTFIRRVGIGTVGLAIGIRASGIRSAHAASQEEDRPSLELLESSPYVYISPLRENGTESSCHAEVWYAWLDDSVVVTVAADRWKATALGNGLTGARIWVGDHGRWKTRLGDRNERFRQAPNFSAHAEKAEEPKMIDRLLEIYDKKYPAQIGRWRDSMKKGNADGSRILIRYRPDPSN